MPEEKYLKVIEKIEYKFLAIEEYYYELTKEQDIIDGCKEKGGLEQLFDYVQNEHIHIIVVADLTILSRNSVQLYDYVKYADEVCHCEFESVNDGFDYYFDIELIKGRLYE